MKNKNIFEVFLCDENGRGIKDKDGKNKTVLIPANNIDDASEIFHDEYPNCFWDDYQEFGD